MLSGFRTQNKGPIKLSPRRHWVKVSSWLRSACLMWKASTNCCPAGPSTEGFQGTVSHPCSRKPLRPPFRHAMDSRGMIGRDINSLHHLLLFRDCYKILCSCMCLLWAITSLCRILIAARIHSELLKHQSLFSPPTKSVFLSKSSVL